MSLLNRARMTTATTGTGTVTLGSAVSGYATFAEAGAVNATAYAYCIEDGADFEIGIGTYTSSGTTFSRDTVTLSKISGTAGTSKINLSGSAHIFVTARVSDLGLTSGTLAQFAATTSLQLAGVISDETGSGALMFGTSPSITTDIRPASNDGASLGISGTAFSDLFLASGGVINWNAGDVTVTHSSNVLAFTGAASGYTFDCGIVITNTNAVDPLTITKQQNSATAGTIIQRKARDTAGSPSAVQSGDTLGGLNVRGYGATGYSSVGRATFSFFAAETWTDSAQGTSFALELTTIGTTSRGSRLTISDAGVGAFLGGVQPFTNDGAALGSSSVSWADLFLASGGVINWNAGDVTITHASNLLTFAGGDYAFNGVVTAASGTATPAGGSTSARLLFGTTAGFGIYYGSGAPTVSAAQGSLYLRSDGSSTSTRLYVNTNGTTGWTNFTSAT